MDPSISKSVRGKKTKKKLAKNERKLTVQTGFEPGTYGKEDCMRLPRAKVGKFLGFF